jgi:RNA polymerase sigma factor (sigma-70 family)
LLTRSAEEISGERGVETQAGGSTGPIAHGVAAPVERPAFADLVRAHLDRLYGFCVHLTNDASDAEDLVQETLMHAMRAYGDLRDPSRARSWLFAIATNAWRDRARARGRRVPTVSIDALDAEGDDFSLFQTIAIEDPFRTPTSCILTSCGCSETTTSGRSSTRSRRPFGCP